MTTLACPICVGAIDQSQNVKDLCSTSCGHVFHADCLQIKLREPHTVNAPKCPSCSKAVRLRNLTPVYPDILQEDEENVASTSVKSPGPKENRNVGGGDASSSNQAYFPTVDFPLVYQAKQNVICGHDQCKDTAEISGTLVDDYNELVKKYLAQGNEFKNLSKELEVLQVSARTQNTASRSARQWSTSGSGNQNQASGSGDGEPAPKRPRVSYEGDTYEDSDDEDTNDTITIDSDSSEEEEDSNDSSRTNSDSDDED